MRETSVWTLRQGKAIRQEAFATKAEALAAWGCRNKMLTPTPDLQFSGFYMARNARVNGRPG